MSDTPKIGSFPGSTFVPDLASGDLTSVVRGGNLLASGAGGVTRVASDTTGPDGTVLSTTGLITGDGTAAPANAPSSVVALTYVDIDPGETGEGGEPDSGDIGASGLNIGSMVSVTPNPDSLAGLELVDLGD